MTLPTNDDLANRELSIEELEAIAAGWPSWVHSAVHAVRNVMSPSRHPLASTAIKIGIMEGAFLTALLLS